MSKKSYTVRDGVTVSETSDKGASTTPKLTTQKLTTPQTQTTTTTSTSTDSGGYKPRPAQLNSTSARVGYGNVVSGNAGYNGGVGSKVSGSGFGVAKGVGLGYPGKDRADEPAKASYARPDRMSVAQTTQTSSNMDRPASPTTRTSYTRYGGFVGVNRVNPSSGGSYMPRNRVVAGQVGSSVDAGAGVVASSGVGTGAGRTSYPQPWKPRTPQGNTTNNTSAGGRNRWSGSGFGQSNRPGPRFGARPGPRPGGRNPTSRGPRGSHAQQANIDGERTAPVSVKRICTGNNTIRTAWDVGSGKTLKSLSCGRMNFRGARRGTPYAAERVGRSLSEQIAGIVPGGKVSVSFSGVHTVAASGRRGLKLGGLKVVAISEEFGVPHNGCRRRKPRRT